MSCITALLLVNAGCGFQMPKKSGLQLVESGSAVPHGVWPQQYTEREDLIAAYMPDLMNGPDGQSPVSTQDFWVVSLCVWTIVAVNILVLMCFGGKANSLPAPTAESSDSAAASSSTSTDLTPMEESRLETFHGESIALQPTAPELLMGLSSSGRVAVETDSGEWLSYAQLCRRAHELAACLAGHGVGPGVLVPILFERSLEMMIAVHGVMASGGTYVPLDTTSPPARLEIIFEDLKVQNGDLPSAAGLSLVTHSSTVERLAGDFLQKWFDHVIHLDTHRFPSDRGSWTFKPPAADSICYTIYTSGSTGRPKGVLVKHCSLANYIAACQQKIPLKPGDVMMQKTPYTFDVSLHEFMCPLAGTAKLYMAKPEGHRNAGYIANTIQQKNITIVHFVPSMFNMFLEYLGAQPSEEPACPSLRMVICIGEALLEPTCRKCFNELPQVQLYDLYGPTEATVAVTYLHVTEDSLAVGKSIGQPLPGVLAYAADAGSDGKLRRTPVGSSAELLLGGVQLARGYLNQPEKTLETFIENSFTKDGSQVYRTGDLVKWRADGHIIYMGRIDRQVKIRGVRIELGEVESLMSERWSVLRQAGAAKAIGAKDGVACVVSAGDLPELIAFVAPIATDSDLALIKAHVQSMLPDYYHPARYLTIAELPSLSNGKVNVNLLQELAAGEPGSSTADQDGGAQDSLAGIRILTHEQQQEQEVVYHGYTIWLFGIILGCLLGCSTNYPLRYCVNLQHHGSPGWVELVIRALSADHTIAGMVIVMGYLDSGDSANGGQPGCLFLGRRDLALYYLGIVILVLNMVLASSSPGELPAGLVGDAIALRWVIAAALEARLLIAGCRKLEDIGIVAVPASMQVMLLLLVAFTVPSGSLDLCSTDLVPTWVKLIWGDLFAPSLIKPHSCPIAHFDAMYFGVVYAISFHYVRSFLALARTTIPTSFRSAISGAVSLGLYFSLTVFIGYFRTNMNYDFKFAVRRGTVGLIPFEFAFYFACTGLFLYGASWLPFSTSRTGKAAAGIYVTNALLVHPYASKLLELVFGLQLNGFGLLCALILPPILVMNAVGPTVNFLVLLPVKAVERYANGHYTKA